MILAGLNIVSIMSTINNHNNNNNDSSGNNNNNNLGSVQVSDQESARKRKRRNSVWKSLASAVEHRHLSDGSCKTAKFICRMNAIIVQSLGQEQRRHPTIKAEREGKTVVETSPPPPSEIVALFTTMAFFKHLQPSGIGFSTDLDRALVFRAARHGRQNRDAGIGRSRSARTQCLHNVCTYR